MENVYSVAIGSVIYSHMFINLLHWKSGGCIIFASLYNSIKYFVFIAVQNERDKITRKPTEDAERFLSPQTLVSAELLSRPAQSPSGNFIKLFICSLDMNKTMTRLCNI